MGGRDPAKLRKPKAGTSEALAPCYRRGNPAFETEEALAAREALKMDNAVVEATKRFWEHFQLTPHNEAEHLEYVRVVMLMVRSLVAVFESSDAVEFAEACWERDSKHADGATFKAFHSFMFELADGWTDSVDAMAYAAFISNMQQRITQPFNPKTERLLAYKMVQVVAGVEDVVDVPSCATAASWADIAEVFPAFLYNDALWGEACVAIRALSECH